MNQAAVQAPLGPEEIREALAARTAQVEEHVRSTFEQSFSDPSAANLAIVAVGGFGRREMFPHSDVDLLILVKEDRDIPAKGSISAFIQPLWDLNLRPSYSVHTIADCGIEHADNLEFSISLLDHRFLFGSEEVYQEMIGRFERFSERRGKELARKLALLADDRRAKYEHTIFHLEPDIKEMPGGFRDIQTIRWLHAWDPHGELPDLAPAFDFLAGIRWRLHEAARRDQNLLTFEAQDSLSQRPDVLMRDYYRHARLVTRVALKSIEASAERRGTLIGRFHARRSRLSTSEFTVSRERVLLRGHRPPTDLRLFEFTARHGLRLAQDTIERLADWVPEADWSHWKQFLNLPKVGPGLRALQQSGVLVRAIPEWEPIECLVIRDFYHRYTVDEHTLRAASALDSIRDERIAGLLESVEDPAIVRFALLMHGLGEGAETPIEQATKIARQVLGRLGASERDTTAVLFLVERQAELGNVITQRDLQDGQLIQELAHTIGSRERLRHLILLTYATLASVNPESLTPFRLEQLWLAYTSIYEELTRELASEKIHHATDDGTDRARFLEGLPMRYLRTHSAADIDVHFALSLQLHAQTAAIDLQHERRLYQLTLLTRDRHGLFAEVVGAVASFGVSIVKAEAFTNAQGIAVDTITFADPRRNLELNPPEVDRMKTVIRKVVEGRQDVARLLAARRTRTLPSKMQIRPEVVFKNEASANSTLIEIVAEDRPGLLHDVCNVLADAGLDIDVVLIDTAAHKAMDVFYVNHNGAKVSPEFAKSLRTDLLDVCIGPR